MKLTTILFDLDGTLLPMDQDVFVKSYFSLLAAKAATRGYEPNALIKGVWAGTGAMVKNDGSCRNEDAFWNTFAGLFGQQALADKAVFDEFYANEFQQARTSCGFTPEAATAIHKLKGAGYRVALATNPIFPAVATQSRIRWAGLEPEDFELYTTYENSSFCKPNLNYYRTILTRLQVQPEECLMVGNDVGEDMVAQQLGLRVFLLTDCLINKPGVNISRYPNGNFAQLLAYIDTLA